MPVTLNSVVQVVVFLVLLLLLTKPVGLYLSNVFAGERNWAHLDVAGPAWREGAAEGYLSVGGTGSGVRTLVELALTME